MDIRFTKVKVDQQHLTSGHTVQGSEVRRQEGLTVTGLRGGNADDHLVLTPKHELNTCTDSTEHLRVTGTRRSTYQRRVLVLRVTQSSDKTEGFQFHYIFRRADLVIEQLAEDNQYKRNQETDNQIGRSRLGLRLGVHDSRCTRLIHDRVIRRVRRFLDLGFRTFLQEKSVVVIVDAVVTLDTYHLQLFLRQFL